MRGHADRGGVDEPVGGTHGGREVLSCLGPTGPEMGGEPGGELIGPRSIEIEDRELRDPERERRMSHGGCGAACPELNHPVSPRVRHPSTEGLGKAVPVGVVADPPAVFEHDRVDGAEGPGRFGQFGQERYDGLLAGVRDVEPVEAQVLGGRQDFGQVPHPSSNPLQIDQAVDVRDALGRPFRFVQGGREGALNALADQAAQDGASRKDADDIRPLEPACLP
jgi:hypothetical protein